MTLLGSATNVLQEGSQTANIRYVGGENGLFTGIGLDLEAGFSTLVENIDFEDNKASATDVKVADSSNMGDVTFVDVYHEEYVNSDTAYSFPYVSGGRTAPTTFVGGRILYPFTTMTNVVFNYAQMGNVVMNGTLFASNAPGQGGVIKFNNTGANPNHNTLHQVTMQNAWSIGALGSNSTVIWDGGGAILNSTSSVQYRNVGLDLWGGALQFSNTSGSPKYKWYLNSGELRLVNSVNAFQVCVDCGRESASGSITATLKSATGTQASSGAIRLANADCINARNAGNTGDLLLVCTNRSNMTTMPNGVQVGSSGSSLAQITKYATASITPTAVSASSCSDQIFPVSGLSKSDLISQVTPPAALGNVTLVAYPSSAGNVLFHFCNASARSVRPPAGVYKFLASH